MTRAVAWLWVKALESGRLRRPACGLWDEGGGTREEGLGILFRIEVWNWDLGYKIWGWGLVSRI